MLSIHKGDKEATAAGYYFKYYDRNKIRDSAWFGNGAELLGLKGPVAQADFDTLIKGYSREGHELVQNAGSENRQGFWDLTFSAPKAVSVLWAAAPDDIKKAIEECIERALHKTLLEAEAECGLSRHGKAGKHFSPAALTFATFFHVTSRENDPQLHWHCVLANVGVRPDGSTGAIYTKTLYQQKIALGLFFQGELAQELRASLNLEIDERKVGFHIKGVPEELCSDMSKRRHQIDEELKATGRDGAEAARAAALLTRKNKKKVAMEALFETWKEEAATYDFGPEQVINLTRPKNEFKQEGAAENDDHPRENGSSQEAAKDSQEKEKARSSNDAKTRNKEWKPERQEPRKWSAAEKAYFKELRKATDRIFPELQDRRRITRLAYAVAKKMEINPSFVPTAIDCLHLPTFKAVYRIEWKKVFWKAPALSPFSKIRTPRFVIRNNPRRWGKVRVRQRFWGIGPTQKEIRIQDRKVFPNVPSWNPLSQIAVPAVRMAKKPKKREELKPLKPVKRPVVGPEL